MDAGTGIPFSVAEVGVQLEPNAAPDIFHQLPSSIQIQDIGSHESIPLGFGCEAGRDRSPDSIRIHQSD